MSNRLSIVGNYHNTSDRPRDDSRDHEEVFRHSTKVNRDTYVREVVSIMGGSYDASVKGIQDTNFFVCMMIATYRYQVFFMERSNDVSIDIFFGIKHKVNQLLGK